MQAKVCPSSGKIDAQEADIQDQEGNIMGRDSQLQHSEYESSEPRGVIAQLRLLAFAVPSMLLPGSTSFSTRLPKQLLGPWVRGARKCRLI